ncbi:ABC transporter permease [Mycoplasma miroungirhinis]|uniref:ABC transporter permease n=1 Tax=Mycoplasma miroungirhinis TaxID=754516 RepID=A0A6M4JIR4_9MOLU|nr:ABC transporter permease [Mycoplasma miroungirhinis]QJR44371.1 ABC transporter permease [Mycoplasma miroungirhinis]
MIRLLKEAFRSLWKNKTTVIGLSILIFITCGLFTLLFDIKKSYTSTLSSYKTVSQMQDLTVNLDVNPNGEVPNGGYNQVNEQGLIDTKPVIYTPDSSIKSYKQSTKNLSIPETELNFLNIRNFSLNNKSLINQDTYIDSSIFQNWFFDHQKNRGIAIFDMQNGSFELTNDITLPIYSKSQDNYSKISHNVVVNKTNIFNFDKEYKLQDIATVINTPTGATHFKLDDYLVKPLDLFLNPLTHQASFDTHKLELWSQDGDVIVISGENVLKQLGFEKNQNDKFYFSDSNNAKDLHFQDNKLTKQNIDKNVLIENQFSLRNYLTSQNISEINSKSYENFTFNKGIKYKFPLNWIQNIEVETEFEKRLFKLNWDFNTEINASNWKGSYLSYISKIYSENNNQIPDDIKEFGFWTKSTKTRWYLQTNSPSDWNIVKEPIAFEDLDVILSLKNNQPTSTDKDTIAEIEKFNPQWNQVQIKDKFNEISNTNLLQLKRNEIAQGANNVAKQAIISKVLNKVGEENVGLRQSLTVETINEGDSKKNIFHFINTGDSNNSIRGVKQNVGKLYNEATEPTILNKTDSRKNIDEYLLIPDKNFPNRKTKLPSEYAQNIVEYIFKGYTPDPNYLDTDIRFEPFYNYYPGTQIPYLTNAKILLLTSEDEDNNTIQYAVTKNETTSKKGEDKYLILVKKEINNEIYWTRLLIPEQDNSLTATELDNFLTQHRLTIKAKIGKEGWAKIDSDYKNSIYLPINYGSVDNAAIIDITQNNKINILIKQIRQTILKTDLANLFTKEQLDKILTAGQIAVEKNQLHNLLASGKTNQVIIKVVIFDWLYELSKATEKTDEKLINFNINTFWKSIVDNFINYIKNKYTYDNNKIRTHEEQKTYLKHELDKLEELLMNITGSKNPFFNNLILGFKISNIIDYIKDYDKFLDSIGSILTSIDLLKFSTLGREWYIQHPYKPYLNANADYYVLSSDEITSFLLRSIDEYKIKTALSNLINQIDFKVLLNPDSQLSIYQKILSTAKDANKPLSNSEQTRLISLFNKLNGYKDNTKAFDNINEALILLINSFSLQTFNKNLVHFLEKSEQKQPVIANAVLFTNNYIKQLKPSNWIASFISALAQDKTSTSNILGKVKTLQDTIKLLANLSSKTQKAAGLYIPANDEEKISFADLGNLGLIRFPKSETNIITNDNIDQYDVNKILSLKQKIDNVITSNKKLIKFSIEESSFLKNVILVNNNEFENLSQISTKLNNYLDLISKLSIKNYQNDLEPYNLNFQEDTNIAIATYGDLAYHSALFNPKSQNTEFNDVLHFLYNQIKPILGNFITKDANGFIGQELNLYAFWIKLTYELKTSIPNITLDEIKKIVLAIFNFMQNSNVAQLLRQYENVDNQIPSYNSILGSDLNNYATILKISKGLANNITSTKEFTNSHLLDILKQDLTKNNLNIYWNDINSWLDKNIYQFVLMMSMLNESSLMPTFYKESQEIFVNNFINAPQDSILDSLITNDYVLSVLYKNVLSYSQLSKQISILGINPIIINPYMALSFPQVLLYTAISHEENEGNIGHLVTQLSRDLETIDIDDLDKLISPIYDSLVQTQELSDSGDKNITLDISYFTWLKNKFILSDKNDQTIFGLNTNKIFEQLLFSLISTNYVNNLIAYNDTSAYLAKINYAYAQKNNKEVYTGNIDEYLQDPFKMAVFINTLDDKYKIKINSVEYLIIGIDITADYLYPVINEENLQVDTSKQSLVYVNSKGFDRIKSAYPTLALKDYLLVQQGDFKATELKQEFSDFIASIATNITNKVFLANELDPINPEISIRITLVQKIIHSIGNVQVFSLIILITLVSMSVYFIIRRYINDRNKVIGILRSQGYRASEISFAFSSFVWPSTIVGSILGYTLGHFIQPIAFRVFSSYWTLPTTIVSFNWLTLVNTFIVPFAFLSILIFLITMFSIRIKAIEQMSGLSELSVGKISQKIAILFRVLPIKSRFIAMLTLNNFWKLFSLFISFSITSLITMFSLSSLNVFQKSIQRTYQNRNYKFKLDLETPTVEGGSYITYNKNSLNDLLYVPDDLSSSSQVSDKNQTDYNSPFYFKPGYSFNTDIINKPFSPTVLTKSSLDILLDTSVEISPWDVTFASLPETQKARIIQIFQQVSAKMFNTQNLHYINSDQTTFDPFNLNYEKLYATQTQDPNSPKTSFFTFNREDSLVKGIKNASSLGQFLFVEYDAFNDFYKKPAAIKTDKVRSLYRNFLIDAYKKIDQNDFFISFGGIIWNNNTNEKYSYAKTSINDQNINIYGYKKDSKFIDLRDVKNKDLKELLYKNFPSDQPLPDNLDNVVLPLVINNVVSKKWNLKEGSIVQLNIENHVDRFIDQILNINNNNHTYTFKVIGINETYINNELITTKEIIDKITGLDTLSNWVKKQRQNELDILIKFNPNKVSEYTQWFNNEYEGFNGILSNDDAPEQTINTLTTYSSSGYWGAVQTYNANVADDKSITDFFKKIFVGQGRTDPMFEFTVYSYNQTHNNNFDWKQKLKEFLNVTNDDYKTWGDQSLVNEPIEPEIKKNMINAINKLYGAEDSIYGKDILYVASQSVNSKDIEAGFISGIASTITNITLAFIIISFIVSIIILIMITNSMINSNRESVATFSILGYSNKEKVYLFFSNYIPIILFASLLMIPITFILMTSFNAFMLATSQMVLPLYLFQSTILISILVSLLVFGITSIFAWISLNKIKPVYLLKGK